MKIVYIYKITNPKNKVYIGSTCNINQRWRKYKKIYCKSQPKIYRSLLKYGVDTHKFEIIAECTEYDRNKQECYYGNLFGVLGANGLNCALPKEDENFCRFSDETIKKMSDAVKNRPIVSKETREKMGAKKRGKLHFHFGVKYSEEYCKKISLGRKNIASGANNWKSKKVINKITGFIYDSANICAKENKIEHSYLCCMLRGTKPNKTPFIYFTKVEGVYL